MKCFYSFSLMVLIACAAFAPQAQCTQSTEHLESNWHKVKLGIGEIVSLHDYFYFSFCLFTSKHCGRIEDDYLMVKNDLNEDVSGTQVIHILGNLNADVTLGEHSELVIGGDVKEHSTIYSDGLSKIFIGGNFNGTIVSISSTQVFVTGDFKGSLYTGSPSTHIVVEKNFEGTIQPQYLRGALLTIKVNGYTSQQTIEQIYAHDFTKINGFFKSSNMSTGVYRPGKAASHSLTIGQ